MSVVAQSHVCMSDEYLNILRFLEALYYSIDGNFHASLKDKPFDPEDVPLTKGAGYFADEDLFAAYSTKLGPLQPEVWILPSVRLMTIANTCILAKYVS